MKRILVVCMLVLCLVPLSACSNNNRQILVTNYPVKYIAERIAKDHIEVKLISEGDTIQVATIKSNYRDLVNNSDILFYINDLESYYDIYNEEIRDTNIKMVDLASKSSYYTFQRYITDYQNGNNYVETANYYDGDIFNNIDIYKNDPMVWMDATAFIGTAETIKNYLSDAYPDYADDFEKNYQDLVKDLALLDAEMQKLKDYKISFVSVTPSFGSWQRAYGIDVYPLILSKYGALPTEGQLQVIEQKIFSNHVRYIVKEHNLNDDMEALYEKVKNDLGLIEIDLSNISLLSKEEKQDNSDYLTIMYENIKQLEGIGE